MEEPAARPRRDVFRDCLLTLITSVVYAAWWSQLGTYALIGTLFIFFPITAFLVVPLHLRFQRPRDSSALAAFATWLLSAPMAGAWLLLIA